MLVFIICLKPFFICAQDSENVFLQIEQYLNANEIENAKSNLIQLKNTQKSNPSNFFFWEANIEFQQENYLSADSLYQLSLTKAQELKDTFLLAEIYFQLGKNNKKLQRFDRAIKNYNKARYYYHLVTDLNGLGQVCLSVGNIYKFLGYSNHAKSEYFKALMYFKEGDNIDKQGSCFNNLGNIYKNENKIDSAFHFMYQALAIRNNGGNKLDQAYIYHNLANLHLKTNRTDSARYYILKSIALKQELKNLNELSFDFNVLGSINLHEKNYSDAILNFNQALSFADTIIDLVNRMDIYRQLGLAYQYSGDYKNATHAFETYLTLEYQFENQKNSELISNELMRYELFTDSIQIKQLELEKELAEIRNQNVSLESDMSQRNFIYVIVILVLFLGIIVILLVTARIRYNQTKTHKQIVAQQSEELRKTQISKEEKEVLLKEIHHRVKNNLQIINSLIRLQSNFINVTNFKEKMTETENRIRSMALIHEKLYKTGNLSKLSVKNYIEELAFNILESYENHRVTISLKFDIEENEYGIDTLIPLGLIMNEILSNAIKHAFFERQKGLITIYVKSDNEFTYMDIRDDGIGADLTYDELKEDSLGLELIESLTDQLDGELKLSTEQGFHYQFKFKLFK